MTPAAPRQQELDGPQSPASTHSAQAPSASLVQRASRWTGLPAGWVAWAVFLGFLALALFRHWSALRDSALSVTSWGDGVGTIGWIYDVGDRLRQQGPRFLFGDFYVSPEVGMGHHQLAPAGNLVMNPFWRTLYGLLTLVMGPDTVYEAVAVLAFATNALGGYLLARALGAPAGAGVALALVACSLDVFDSRVVGHLGMTVVLFCFLAPVAIFKFAQAPGLGRGVAAGLSLWAVFLGNEYYGFFGGLFCLAILIGYTLVLRDGMRWRAWVGGISAAVLIGFLGLVASHRTIVSALASKLFGGDGGLLRMRAFEPWAFSHYSLRSPRSLFGSPGLAASLGEVGEFTFRVGWVLPLLVLITAATAALLWVTKRNTDGSLSRSLVGPAVVWLVAAAVMIAFAAHPLKPYSLVGLTQRYFSMFRVGLRALLFFDIAVIALAALSAQFWWRLSDGWSATARRLLRGGVLATIVVAGLVDVPSVPWRTLREIPPVAYQRPPSPALEVLAKAPVGTLVELPFHDQVNTSPEEEYWYLLNRSVHHQPILNLYGFEPDRAQWSVKLAGLLNTPGPATLQLLQQSGIRYVVVNQDAKVDAERYTRLEGLELLSEAPGVRVYSVLGAGAWNEGRLLELLGSSP